MEIMLNFISAYLWRLHGQHCVANIHTGRLS